MALSLLCGGLGVAEASVHVNEVPDGTKEVYTIGETYSRTEADARYAKANDVTANTTKIDTNKANITALQTTATEQGKLIATNTANIANNTTDIEKKIDKELAETKLALKANAADVYSRTDANDTFATKTELNAKANATALDGKANTDLSNLTADGVNKIKATMSEDMEKKANKADVYSKTDADTTFATKTELASYATTAYVDGKITVEENARNIAIQTAISGEAENRKNAIDAAIAKEVADRNQAIKTEVDKEANARDTAIANAKNDLQTKITEEKTAREALDTRLTKAEDKITANETAIDNLKTKDTENVKYDNATVKDQITLGGAGGTKITNLKDADLSDSSSDAVTGKQLNKTNKDLKTEAQTRQDMDTLLSNRADVLEKNTGGITRNDAKDETYIEKNVTVDNKGNVTAKGKLKGEVVDAGAVNAGSLIVENVSTLKGDVTMNQKLSVTGDTSLNNTDVGGKLNVTGESSLKNTTVGGTLTAEKDATFEKNVTVEKDLTVNGKLNVDKISMKNDELKNGKKHDSATTITADEISNLAKVTDENGNTTESQFTHNEKGTFNYARDQKITGEWKGSTSNVTADGVSNTMTDSDKNKHTYHQTATESKEQLVNGDKSKSNFEKKTAEGNTISITEKDADGNLKSSLTNTQTVNGEKTSVTNKDSSSTINQGADQIRYNVTSKDENTTSSSIEVKADGITNTSKDGTITNDAKDIENNATGDMTNNVGGKLTTTVNGAAEETYKSGLKTDITGDETHTVTGKQTNTVKGGQENNISGGQKNNILTGNQETTVSDGSIINKAEHGDISNTAKNVTNEGTESVTNKVGTNEVKVSKDGVDIKVDADKTIKESVGADTSRTMTDGRIIDKAGDMTVTTDKTTGTTFGNGTPNDTTVINGGTIGTNKVNANETNTKKLTAGAAADADGGRLTVDAKDGVKGSYKSGEYTSRSYILANTLKSGVDNGKEPIDADFVGSRTDHYMVGDKAKLDETVKDAAGSNVTTKTSTSSKSEIQNADTITSVQQTESMVQSYVGKKDGSATNVTTNFANASANQVTENGQTSTVLNNKDGLLIRNTANGSSFTTDDGTNTGSALEWTNVKGNEISTGKVEANYVKMDYADVMRDLGVRGNANITGKTTTGSLEVTGTSTLKGDVTMEKNATVKNNLNVEGITTTKTLSVTENATVGGTLDVTGKATFKDFVSIAKDLSVDGNATIKGDVTAKSYKVGDKTYISADGINANDQKITNVADGSISEGSKDAVNGGQLYGMKTDLEHKVDKVGANAAAMANLHPMEFDPDSKWNIAAAMGNYGSETATAIGAFYRPNEDVMVNFSTAFGTGENMVGGGVSVRLGKGSNKLSRQESNALKAQVNDLTARMDALLSVLNPNMSKDFPDVPENHWAYEAVSRLAGNDIVQGYPDGEFHGERTMTRYEMAEIIYNALSRGAEAERELVEEFKPELQAMAASEKATAERAEG